MEKKENITLRTMKSTRKKVLYNNFNVNESLTMHLTQFLKENSTGERGTRGKELLYALFIVTMNTGLR